MEQPQDQFSSTIWSCRLELDCKKAIIRELLERGAIEAAKKEIDIHAQSQNIHQNSTAGIALSNNLQNLKLFDELQSKLGKYYINIVDASGSCLIQAAGNQLQYAL